MRLTLRTLLAYLDDVLEPAEAQDLGGRIRDNEFATNLVHRIREAMRREKLGAPRLRVVGDAHSADGSQRRTHQGRRAL